MARVRSREEPETVQAVSRALAILEAMAGEGALGLTELARKVGLKTTTAHRLLATLAARGFAEQEPATLHYRLGPKAFEIGTAALAAMDIRATARPFLKELVERLNETTNLAILDNGQIVYIDQVESTNIVIVKMFARVGSRGPAHCTGSGKVLLAGLADEELAPLLRKMNLERFTASTITDPQQLLAELRRIRAQGYALDVGERDEEVRCVAAPIRNFEGRVVAAVSVSGPAARMPEELLVDRFVPVVVEATARISARLGFTGTAAGGRNS